MSVSAVLVTRGDVDLAPVLGSLPLEWEVVVWNNGAEKVGVSPPHTSRLMTPYSIEGSDLAVYGRYAAIEYASGDLIYIQDDDCVLPPESIEGLIEMWSAWAEHPGNPHGESLLASNMPAAFRHDFYSDHCLVGFGAVFHRDLPGKAFDRFEESPRSGTTYLAKPLPFKRECVGNVILQSNSPHRKNYVLNEEFWRTCDIVFTGLTPRVLVDVPYENLPWAEDETRMYRSENHVAERTRMLDLVRQVRDA